MKYIDELYKLWQRNKTMSNMGLGNMSKLSERGLGINSKVRGLGLVRGEEAEYGVYGYNIQPIFIQSGALIGKKSKLL